MNKRKELAEKYASECYYGYYEAQGHREIASMAHEVGQDEGFEEALSILNSPEAEAKFLEWEKIGLKAKAVEWLRWLREKKKES